MKKLKTLFLLLALVAACTFFLPKVSYTSICALPPFPSDGETTGH